VDTLDVFTLVIGPLRVSILVVVIAGLAGALDYFVSWLRDKRCNETICRLIHYALILIVAMDCCVAVAYSAAGAWELRPWAERLHTAAVPRSYL
jgi:thiosulfate reductase cytochrome b subunit